MIGVSISSLAVTIALAIAFSAIGARGFVTYTVQFGCFAAILLCCATADLYRSPIPVRLRWVGDITYAVYLIHMPILVSLLVIAKLLGWTESLLQGPLVLIGYGTLVLFLSWFAYQRFEMPAQNWLRRRLVPKRREPEEAETALTI